MGEMVTVDDQQSDFVLQKVNQERKTADLTIITTRPVKPKEVPISELNKDAQKRILIASLSA